MKRRMKAAAVAALTISVTLAGAASAHAHNAGFSSGAPNGYASNSHVTGSAVNGGNWFYGVHDILYGGPDENVDSSYYHGTRKHRSSVTSNGVVTRSGDKAPGIWAQATRDRAASGNTAHWYTY